VSLTQCLLECWFRGKLGSMASGNGLIAKPHYQSRPGHLGAVITHEFGDLSALALTSPLMGTLPSIRRFNFAVFQCRHHAAGAAGSNYPPRRLRNASLSMLPVPASPQPQRINLTTASDTDTNCPAGAGLDFSPARVVKTATTNLTINDTVLGHPACGPTHLR